MISRPADHPYAESAYAFQIPNSKFLILSPQRGDDPLRDGLVARRRQMIDGAVLKTRTIARYENGVRIAGHDALLHHADVGVLRQIEDADHDDEQLRVAVFGPHAGDEVRVVGEIGRRAAIGFTLPPDERLHRLP